MLFINANVDDNIDLTVSADILAVVLVTATNLLFNTVEPADTGYVCTNDSDVVPTVIAPVVVSVQLDHPLTVPPCTHIFAPKSTSLLVFASKSVALVHDPAFCNHIPFSAHAVCDLTRTLCAAAPATPSIVWIPDSVIFAVVADATSSFAFADILSHATRSLTDFT